MYKIIILFVLLLSFTKERYYVSGKLVDTTGHTLYGIKIECLDKTVYSDFDGSFKVEIPKENQVQIDFSLNKIKLKTIYTCTETPNRDLGIIILKQ